MKSLELKVPPAVVLLACGAGMWLVARAAPAADVTIPARWILAAVLFAVGVGLGLRGVLAFRRHQTTVHPSRPETASAVVTSDVYRYTRNPMYLGLALVLCAWAVALENLVAPLGVPVFMAYLTVFQIRPEERALSARFGAPYDDYRRAVRRWI